MSEVDLTIPAFLKRDPEEASGVAPASLLRKRPSPSSSKPAETPETGAAPAKAKKAKKAKSKPTSWRSLYEVHPAADLFPMMSDDELQKLGEDIEKNGLREPIKIWRARDGKDLLIDGRNRLEAYERMGFRIPKTKVERLPGYKGFDRYSTGMIDPIAYILSANIHRRHLSKEEKASLIVAAYERGNTFPPAPATEYADKPRQVGEVSKGGRGKEDAVKKSIVATAEAAGISKRTVERAMTKSRAPAQPELDVKAERKAHPSQQPGMIAIGTSIEAARKRWLKLFAQLTRIEQDAELKALTESAREARSKGGRK